MNAMCLLLFANAAAVAATEMFSALYFTVYTNENEIRAHEDD